MAAWKFVFTAAQRAASAPQRLGHGAGPFGDSQQSAGHHERLQFSGFRFQCALRFTDRYAGQKDFFSSDMKPGEQEDRVVNFIPDLSAVTLDPLPERGIGFSRLGIHLSGNSMVGHIMAIESGTYKKAHRHGPGAQVIVIAGKDTH